MKRLMTCLVVAGALAFGGGLVAAAEKVTGEKPAATEKPAVTLSDDAAAAIAKAFPKATVKSVRALGKADDVKNYDATMTEGDKTFTVRVHTTGVIVSVSSTIAVADLPKAVADAAAKAVDGATVKSAMKVEQRAQPRKLTPLDKPEISYAVTLVKDDTQGVAFIAEDGTVKRDPKMAPVKKPKDTTEK